MSSYSTPKAGTEYQPEFYVQVLAKGGNVKQMNPLLMKSEELLHGILNVYIHLLERGQEARG